jgi:hypothetical protein
LATKTIDEFIPQWTDVVNCAYDMTPILKKRQPKYEEISKLAAKRGLYYSEGAKCFLGEAYGFKDGWQDCETCDRLGFGVSYVLCFKNDFFKYKQELYDHIKKKHRGLLKK